MQKNWYNALVAKQISEACSQSTGATTSLEPRVLLSVGSADLPGVSGALNFSESALATFPLLVFILLDTLFIVNLVGQLVYMCLSVRQTRNMHDCMRSYTYTICV